jgi:hypothetical protein
MGAHPLELAVFGQDVVYFQELLAYGKRIRSIPSRNWDVGRRGTPDARTLIRSLISDSTLRAGFLDLMERASRGEKILTTSRLLRRRRNLPAANGADSL